MGSATTLSAGPGTVGAVGKVTNAIKFTTWAENWLTCAKYAGPDLLDVEARIDAVLELWRGPVPTGWERGDDPTLLDPTRRYRRTHAGRPDGPVSEALLESDVLTPDPAVVSTTCFGAALVDGCNAVALQRSNALTAGHRAGNVEADMLLLARSSPGYHALLVEVKVASDTPWYALVENLRQLRLYCESPAAQRILRLRSGARELPKELPVTGVVLAPRSYYRAPAKKSRSVAPALRLAVRMKAVESVDCKLAIWNTDSREISELDS
jgi:hypothetical protein